MNSRFFKLQNGSVFHIRDSVDESDPFEGTSAEWLIGNKQVKFQPSCGINMNGRDPVNFKEESLQEMFDRWAGQIRPCKNCNLYYHYTWQRWLREKRNAN